MNNARIPVVDISTFRDGTDRPLVARRVADACRDTGFFVITGHGVERDLIRAVRESALGFFRQSPGEKARYHGHGSVGYSPFAEERLANSLGEETPPDLKEGFTVAQVDVTEDGYYTDDAAAFFYPNNGQLRRQSGRSHGAVDE